MTWVLILGGLVALLVLMWAVLRGQFDHLNQYGRSPATDRFPQQAANRSDLTMLGDAALVTDPMCGKRIPLQTALVHRVGNRVGYFCSAECRAKFISR